MGDELFTGSGGTRYEYGSEMWGDSADLSENL
jgi:hypothetical protein